MKYLKYLLILIVLLLLFFFGRGLLTPSISYGSEVLVHKPASEAWAVMTDESSLPKWIKGFKKSEPVSGTPNTVGAVSKNYIEEQSQEMIMEETINKIIPNELLGMTFTMDFMNMDYELRMKESAGKTTITTKTTASGNGLFAKSMVSFMSSAMKKQEDDNLSSLKKLIDSNTTIYNSGTDEVKTVERVEEVITQ